MSRIDLVQQLVARHLDNPRDLLALRLMFPPDRIEITIDREIKDLYKHPERLQTSYRDEWRLLAVRGLFRHGFSDDGSADEKNLEQYLAFLQNEAIPRCIHENTGLFRCLGEIVLIAQAENTLVFRDPKRRAMIRLIWPEGK